MPGEPGAWKYQLLIQREGAISPAPYLAMSAIFQNFHTPSTRLDYSWEQKINIRKITGDRNHIWEDERQRKKELRALNMEVTDHSC